MLRALGVGLVSLALMAPAAEAKGHGHRGGRGHGHAYGHRKHARVVRTQTVRPVRYVVDRDGNTRRTVRTRYVVGRPLAVSYRYADPWMVSRYAPAPYGYRYVVVDDDVLLMNVATRVVANAFLNALR